MTSKSLWACIFSEQSLWNLIVITLLMGFSASSSGTVKCMANCPHILTTSLNRTLGESENIPGKVFDNGSTTRGALDQRLVMTSGYHNIWSVLGDDPVPPVGTYNASPQWKKIDDYVSISLIRRGPAVFPGQMSYLPINIESNILKGQEQDRDFSHGSLEIKVRIDKSIINGVYSRNILAATEGMCNGRGCRNKEIITNRLYFNLNFTVPQTCTLNQGQTLDFSFGNISSAAFTTAGARAEGVNDIVRNIPIECNGIAANTAMTVRLQADKVSGKAVVTNNNEDVGFVVADGNGTALTPNNISSIIPFNLGGDNKSSVTIRVYPVSVTGNKPSEGPVTSQAYLRVDFA